MSDLLSQDEIDALLHGVDDVEEEEAGEDFESAASTIPYEDVEADAAELAWSRTGGRGNWRRRRR